VSQNTDILLALCFMRTSTTFFGVLLHVFMEFLSISFTFILFVSFFLYVVFFFCCGPRIGDKVMILNHC
jgi:hypothetical protein